MLLKPAASSNVTTATTLPSSSVMLMKRSGLRIGQRPSRLIRSRIRLTAARRAASTSAHSTAVRSTWNKDQDAFCDLHQRLS